MLHVILTILKILGIIIASILGIILLILLLVLFVPVRYKLRGTKKEKFSGTIRLNWLFRIISVYISFNNEKLEYKLKIFGISILSSNTDDSNEKQNLRKVKKVIKKESKVIKDSVENTIEKALEDDFDDGLAIASKNTLANSKEKVYNRKVDTEIDIEKHIINNIEKINVQIHNIDNNKDDHENFQRKFNNNRDNTNNIITKVNTKKIKDKKDFKYIFDLISNKFKTMILKIQLIFTKIKLILTKSLDTIIGIYNHTIDFKDTINEKIHNFNENINTEENRQLLKFLLVQTKVLLKHISPRKHKIYIKFGAADPYLTGQIISYTAMANAFLNLNLNFVPVFDELVFEGEAYLRGRIRVFTILRIAFRVYRNKQFKIMLKKFK